MEITPTEGRAGLQIRGPALPSVPSGLLRGVFVESTPVGKSLLSKRSMTGILTRIWEFHLKLQIVNLNKKLRCHFIKASFNEFFKTDGLKT